MIRFLQSLACRVHAVLFSYMTRAGLILCDVDPAMIQAALQRIAADVDSFKTGQKEKLGEAVVKLTELQARMLQIEQLQARGGGDPGPGHRDDGGTALRALLETSDDLRALADRKIKRVVLEMPPGTFKAQIISGGGLAMPGHEPGIVMPVQRRFTIRALIPSIPVTVGSVQYTRETGYTNNAATVSESDQKPESNLTFALLTAAIVTIAHWIRTSAQVLSDTPMLQAYIEGRLRYGVALAEETQILRGSGIGNNLSGLMTQATAYSGGGGYEMMDVLRRAAGQLEDTDYQPSGFVLHPADWRQIQLKKDNTGRYILGDPGGDNPARLWNLPVVPTPAMTAENFLVLDGPQAAVILDREGTRVDISTETDDDFTTNRCHIRAENRVGLATLRTGALVKGVFAS